MYGLKVVFGLLGFLWVFAVHAEGTGSAVNESGGDPDQVIKRVPSDFELKVSGIRTHRETKRMKREVYRGLASVTAFHETELSRHALTFRLRTASTEQEISQFLRSYSSRDGAPFFDEIQQFGNRFEVHVRGRSGP